MIYKINDFFQSLPRWYLLALGALFVLYMAGWAYTVHLAQIQRAAGEQYVMPLAEHDPTSYGQLAQSILQGRFAEPDEQYEYFHTPGYPAFAAVLLFVSGGSFFAVTFVQVLLVFAVALMTAVLGVRLASPRIGYWASILFLANPIVPYNTFYVLTDILFTFLLTFGFLLVILFFRRYPWRIAFGVGIIFAAAVYVRPVGFLALPIFLAPLAALEVPWKKKILCGALIVAVIGVLVLPWMLRNKTTSGVFAFSSLVPFNMSYYSIPHFWLDTQNLSLEKGIARVEQESGAPAGFDARGYPANWYNLSSSPKLSAFYQSVVFASPLKYAAWHLYYSTAFFISPAISPPDLSQNIKGLLLKRQISAAFQAITAPWWFFAERMLLLGGLVLLCIGVLHLRRNWLALVFFLVILYFAALGGPSTAARYRLPLEPLLSIFMVTGAAAVLVRTRLITKEPMQH